jgi:hypothetical protein
MGADCQIEYNDDIITSLHLMWDYGYIAPSGPEEVAEHAARFSCS